MSMRVSTEIDARFSTSLYHVNIEDRNTETEVILVEYTLKLLVQKDRAVGERRTAPRIEAAALKFH